MADTETPSDDASSGSSQAASCILTQPDEWHKVEIRDSPTCEGLGIFAKENILPGICILYEKALIDMKPLRNLPSDVEYSKWKVVIPALGPDVLTRIRNLSYSPQKVEYFKHDARVKGIILTDEEAQILAIVDRNRWVSGLYDKASRFNHSCVPNVFLHCANEEAHIVVHTTRDIEAGEELFCSYILPEFPRQRRRELLAMWDFNCHCEACAGPKSDRLEEMRRQIIFGKDQLERYINKKPDLDSVDEAYWLLEEIKAKEMVPKAKAQVARCCDAPWVVELLKAYIILTNVYRRVNDPLSAGNACENAWEWSRTMMGAEHRETVNFQQAEDTIRNNEDYWPLIRYPIACLDAAF